MALSKRYKNIKWNDVLQDTHQSNNDNNDVDDPGRFYRAWANLKNEVEMAKQRNKKYMEQEITPSSPWLNQFKFQNPQDQISDSKQPMLYRPQPLVARRNKVCPLYYRPLQQEESIDALLMEQRRQAGLEESKRMKKRVLEITLRNDYLVEQLQRGKRKQPEHQQQQQSPQESKRRKIDHNEPINRKSRKLQTKQQQQQKAQQRKRNSKSEAKKQVESTIVKFPRYPKRPISVNNPTISLVKRDDKYYFNDKTIYNDVVNRIMERSNVMDMLDNGEYQELCDMHNLGVFMYSQDEGEDEEPVVDLTKNNNNSVNGRTSTTTVSVAESGANGSDSNRTESCTSTATISSDSFDEKLDKTITENNNYNNDDDNNDEYETISASSNNNADDYANDTISKIMRDNRNFYRCYNDNDNLRLYNDNHNSDTISKIMRVNRNFYRHYNDNHNLIQYNDNHNSDTISKIVRDNRNFNRCYNDNHNLMQYNDNDNSDTISKIMRDNRNFYRCHNDNHNLIPQNDNDNQVQDNNGFQVPYNSGFQVPYNNSNSGFLVPQVPPQRQALMKIGEYYFVV